MKLALCMIVKPSDEEAELLKRCLNYVAPHVDGIFITITGENEKCEDVAKAFGAVVSHYKWDYSFANARNYALSQVPADYDYWMWLDCDDVLRGAEKLKSTIEEHPTTDVFTFNYLYAFDEHQLPIVVHMKSRVLKHDGCVEWAGDLHEDFKENRKITAEFVDGIDVLHLTNDDRVEESRVRNVEVAEKSAKHNPNDPRSFWNLGNAYKAAGDNEKALATLEKFMMLSHSEEEKYIIHMRLAEIKVDMGQFAKALDNVSFAIGMRPEYPDAYHLKGHILEKMDRLADAEKAFLQGLVKKPPYHKIIVFNPRAYDYQPMMSLARIYFKMSKPTHALPLLEGCAKIYPKDKTLKKLIKEMRKKSDEAMKAFKWIGKLKDLHDQEFLEMYEKIPADIRSFPQLCHLRNTRIIKDESSGNELVFYCGYTEEIWTPETAKTKGIGGSEEAVIHLSKQLADLGWDVTVYNNCGHLEQEFDGVNYKPFWMWNYRDKRDVTILWRSAKPLDYKINSDKVFVDLHDVIDEGEFNTKRLESVDRIMVKSKAHRDLFPNVPDDKFAVIENGIVWEDMQKDIERDEKLMICTSSPDRHLSALIKGFKKIKEQVPDVKCEWAYGWGVWDIVHGEDAEAMEWKQKIMEEIEELDDFKALGRVSHEKVAEMYQRAGVFAYPTAFFEIDCISARKAQAGGAALVTTDFAALEYTVRHGVKVHVDESKENWGKPYVYDFAVQDEETLGAWVTACVAALQNPLSEEDRKKQREEMLQFDWTNIAARWNSVLK